MANYGTLTYAPTKIGGQPGYTFSRTGAKPINLFGDPAEKLKAQIDRARAAQNQQELAGGLIPLGLDTAAMRRERDVEARDTAADAPRPEPRSTSVAGTIGDIVAGPVGGAMAERMAQPRPETKVAPKPSQRPIEKPQETKQPEQVQTQQRSAQQGGFELLPGKMYRKPGDPRIYEWVPGSAGSPGGMRPVAQTTQVEGARKVNEEFLQGLRAYNQDRQQIASQALDQGLAAAEEERKAARAQMEASRAAEIEKQQELADQRQEMAKQEELYTKAREDFRTAKIDPNRVFAGDVGTMKQIGAAIAAAAGQWGSMVAGGPNNALAIVEGVIDRNIDAQRQEIETKRGEVDNALNDLVRRGMSMGQAEKTLKAAQIESAAANTRYLIAQSAPGELQTRYAELVNAMDRKQLEIEEAYRRESEGKVTRTLQEKYQAPRAATAGGEREVSMKKYQQLADLTGKVLKNEKMAAESEKGTTSSDIRNIAGLSAQLKKNMEALSRYVPKSKPGERTSEEERLNKSPLPEAQPIWTRKAWEKIDKYLGEGTFLRWKSQSEQVRYETFLEAQQALMEGKSIFGGMGVIREHEEPRYKARTASAQTMEALYRIYAQTLEGSNARLTAMKNTGAKTWQEYVDAHPDAASDAKYSIFGND